MNQRVTLRDIAKAAGVHYSTASLALRKSTRISQEVRDRVNSIAGKLGYSPDAALSALNAYRKAKLQAHYQSTIAWIDNWSGQYRLRDQPTFNEYFLGASGRAKELGYDVEEFSLGTDRMSPDQLSRILRNRGIKGLLLPPQPTVGTPLGLTYEWFSIITFGYSFRPQIFNLVTNHQIHSALLGFNRMKELGYKRIGLFVHQNHDDKVENAYQIGYWMFHKKNPNEQQIEPCIVPHKRDAEEIFVKWFGKTSPDSILFLGGFEVVPWLKKLGLRVPKDVGVANFSLANAEPELSGVYENGVEIGRIAVNFLVEMVHRGEFGPSAKPIRILVEGEWRNGKTTRRQK